MYGQCPNIRKDILGTSRIQGYLLTIDISSDKPVAMVSGAMWRLHTNGTIVEYIPPIKSLGKTFIVPYLPVSRTTIEFIYTNFEVSNIECYGNNLCIIEHYHNFTTSIGIIIRYLMIVGTKSQQ